MIRSINILVNLYDSLYYIVVSKPILNREIDERRKNKNINKLRQGKHLNNISYETKNCGKGGNVIDGTFFMAIIKNTLVKLITK